MTYFVQSKENLLQNCHRLYIMVSGFMYLNYFFHKLNVQNKRESCKNRLQFLFYVNADHVIMLTKGLYFCTSWTCAHAKQIFLSVFTPNIFSILNVFARCYHWVTLNLPLHNNFEQKPIAFLKFPVHIVQAQRFAFNAVISPSLTVRTLGSNAVTVCIVIHSSC